jgi:hypothetical protein
VKFTTFRHLNPILRQSNKNSKAGKLKFFSDVGLPVKTSLMEVWQKLCSHAPQPGKARTLNTILSHTYPLLRTELRAKGHCPMNMGNIINSHKLSYCGEDPETWTPRNVWERGQFRDRHRAMLPGHGGLGEKRTGRGQGPPDVHSV